MYVTVLLLFKNLIEWIGQDLEAQRKLGLETVAVRVFITKDG